MQTQNKDSIQRDSDRLISIVKAMTESSTGEQATKHWAKDALWFDIPAFASRGIVPAAKMFDSVFKNFKSCEIDILETEVIMSSNMGIVCTIQKVEIVFHNDINKALFVRQTDCFKQLNDTWMLVHQHASVPSGGEWDGKIITG